MLIYAPPHTFDPEKHFRNVSLNQSLCFRNWKEACGHRTVSLVVSDPSGTPKVYIQCIAYRVPLTGTLWVAVRGPVGSFSDRNIEIAFYGELRRLCVEAEPRTSHIRVQYPPSAQRTVPAEQTPGSFNQPSAEQIVQLDGDMDDIVNRFAKNTKRMVRNFERNRQGIRFHIETTDFRTHLSAVHDLLMQAALLKGFSPHPYAYYETLFDTLTKNPEYGSLVLGYLPDDKKPVSAVLTMYTGTEAYQLISGNDVRGYNAGMPTFAMYLAIREAKKQGLRRYNLGVVSSGSYAQRSLKSQSLFKEKFGGAVVDHGHPRDIVVSMWRYWLFRFMRLYPVTVARRVAARSYRAVMVELREG